MTTGNKGYGIDIRFKKLNINKSAGIDALLAPSNEGRMTPVKNKMLEIICGADPSLLPQDTHVRGDWKLAINYFETNYPVVTLRLGSENVVEQIYGRQMNAIQRGHYVIYSFSAHVWGEKSYQLFDEGADEHQTQARLASDLADIIIDTLEKYNGDETSGICYFDNITARESEPERGPQRLTRIIVEGFIFVKRPLV